MSRAEDLGLGVSRSQLGVLVLIGFGQALTLIGLFVLFGAVIDGVQTGVPVEDLVPELLLLGLVMGANAALRGVQFVVAERMGYESVRRLRMTMYEHLTRMYPREVQHRSRGALLLRFTGDVTMFRTWVSRGIAPGLVAVLVIVIATLGIGVLNPWIALVLLSVLLGGSALSLAFGMWLRQTTRRVRRRRSLLTSNIQEQLGSLGTVQAFGHGGGEFDRLSDQNDDMTSTILREVSIRGTLRAISAWAGWLGVLAVLGFGAVEATAGRASVGVVVAAAIAAHFLTSNVSEIGLAHDYWQRANVSRRKIAEFLASSASRPLDHEVERLRARTGQIEFQAVSVIGSLDKVSATAGPNEIIAVVGPTGAGKSTLLHVVSRLVNLQSGRVLIDDQDLANCTATSIARQMGVFSPELPLMRGTLRRNLAYRARNATPDEMLRVTLAWQLDEALADLPGGLDGWLTEGASNVSAGQRQLIGLARAFMGNPRLVILDDPTAHLDARGKQILERVVRRHSGTVLVATNDPSVQRWADRVWYLEHGRLVEDRQVEAGRPAEQPMPGPN